MPENTITVFKYHRNKRLGKQDVTNTAGAKAFPSPCAISSTAVCSIDY
jgi:hypothetical protein